MVAAVALPYGIRDVQLLPYPTLEAIAFGDELIDLPNIQTFSFSEAEEYTELRGDDKLVTSHGQGAQIDGTLESGGVSLEAYQALNGGEIIEGGTTPDLYRRYRKRVSHQRPFNLIIGKAISDSGGDFHAVVWKARATGDIGGEFSDGEFFIPSTNITGFPCTVEGLVDGEEIYDTLYDFIHNESIQDIVAPAIDTPPPTP